MSDRKHKKKKSRKDKGNKAVPSPQSKRENAKQLKSEKQTAPVSAAHQTSAVDAQSVSTSVSIVPQNAIVVEVSEDKPNVKLSTSKPTLPSKHPGNKRFVVGINARKPDELVVIDRIGQVRIATAPILAEPTEQTLVQVKITKMLVRMCERLYTTKRSPQAKQQLSVFIGKAIEAVGWACLF